VAELAAECEFYVSAPSPGVQNRLQMTYSCTRCGLAASTKREYRLDCSMISLTCCLCDPKSQSA